MGFSNGEKKSYDIGPLLHIDSFSPLKNLPFFKSFCIEPGGVALSWGDRIDISEYELWKNGVSL